MGLTAHLFLAIPSGRREDFDALLTPERDDFRRDPSWFQADELTITREDHEVLHLFLRALEALLPELAGLGNVVIGHDEAAYLGMGIQFFFPAEAVKTMADAYGRVTAELFAAALVHAFPDFDAQWDGALAALLDEQFTALRKALRHLADHGWALVAGMF